MAPPATRPGAPRPGRPDVGPSAPGGAHRSSRGLGVGAMIEESLFAAALERATAAERRAFLDEACAGDVPLRQRVERLLAADEKTRGIVDWMAGSPRSPEVTAGGEHVAA